MSDDLERQLRERFQRAVLPSAPFSLRASLEAIVQTPVERTVRRDRRRTWGLMAVAAVVTAGGLLLVTGGGFPPTETALVPTPTPRPSPSSPVASASPSVAPSLPSSPASATLPVTGSAREIGMRVQMASGPGGSLFVSIPRPGGSVLALLDSSGRPRPGWPVTVTASTECGLVLPVDDGSVRVVCTMENPDGNQFAPVGAFAFGSNGKLLAGWPVAIEGTPFRISGRTVGDRLTLFTERALGDFEEPGNPTRYNAGIVTVAADGRVVGGTRVPGLGAGSGAGAVDPDGIAYGVLPDLSVSQIGAVGPSGMRTGWPVSIDGIASGPAFGPGGRIVLTVASPARNTSQVMVLDRDGEAIRDGSAAIPIVTSTGGDTGGCSPPSPQPPVVAQDGTAFVFSELDTAIFALDPSLAVMRGWPFEPATPLVRRDERYVKEDAYCPSLAIPAVGPDSTLYMPVQARTATVGGNLVAVGPEGKVRPGWPVKLTRPGSEFWSVAVGSDGTAYALAIEPESSTSSSATILAIAPDSTVLYTTTIVEP